jgi:hypothetical protein
VSDNDEDLLVVQGKRYWKQRRWSKDKKVNPRTTARHRQRGLPWLDWGGEIFIPELEGDAYIASRVRRRNPPRRGRQATSAENLKKLRSGQPRGPDHQFAPALAQTSRPGHMSKRRGCDDGQD